MFNIFNKNKSISIVAPMAGSLVDITKVEDDVFSEKLVGDGIAINPTEGTVTSPVKGTVVQVFPTGHALGIRTLEGLEILLHIGLDTVELKGEGFKVYVKTGDNVDIGDKLLDVDLDMIKESGRFITSPIIITNMDMVKSISTKSGKVDMGKDIIMDVNIWW